MEPFVCAELMSLTSTMLLVVSRRLPHAPIKIAEDIGILTDRILQNFKNYGKPSSCSARAIRAGQRMA